MHDMETKLQRLKELCERHGDGFKELGGSGGSATLPRLSQKGLTSFDIKVFPLFHSIRGNRL